MRSASVNLVAAVLASCALVAGGCDGGGDLSTPKGAATAFAKAMESGDVEAAKRASTGGDPAMVEAMVKAMSSMKKLQDAAIAKFGEQGKKIGNDGGDMDMEKKVNEAEVKVEGDTATLTHKDKGDPMKLKKVVGEWKVDTSEMSGPAAGMGVAMMNAMGKAADEVAGEIKAGKYKTAEEAEQAMGQKMFSGMVGPPQE